MYEDNNGQYPTPYSGWPITGNGDFSNEIKDDGIMSAVPTDPINVIQGSNDYRYLYTGDGATYTITYYLETGSIPGQSAGENTISP